MHRGSAFFALLVFTGAFAAACEAELNEKHVWVAAAHGFDGGAGALVDGPISEAATSFARRNGLAVTSSATPCSGEANCDLAAARAAGAGTVLVTHAQAGGLDVKLLDAATGKVVGTERAADASSAGPAVDRVLYARFGGTPATASGATVARPEEPPPDTAAAPAETPAPAATDGEPRDTPKKVKREREREPSSDKIVGKKGPPTELKRGDANGGTLILMNDALHWKPPSVNIAGARAQKFMLSDIKRIFVEGGKLTVHVSWGPKYTFDTKEDEMRWRNAIDDARSDWTGQPKDK